MEPIDIKNVQVTQALNALFGGRTIELLELVHQYPWLVKSRFCNNDGGYFKDPYLLWFIAGNPTGVERLPGNIIELTRELLAAIRHYAAHTYPYQIAYALGLVVSGHTLRQYNVQLPMIELLISAGAMPNKAMDALTHGHLEAAEMLIELGNPLNLTLAVCLERESDIRKLIQTATSAEKTTALAAAAYFGKAAHVEQLLTLNIDPNQFPMRDSGFHSHATPLHQAVSSGSLLCVRLLVEAGARPDVADQVYHGTPLGWAAHLQASANEEAQKSNFSLVKEYLNLVQ